MYSSLIVVYLYGSVVQLRVCVCVWFTRIRVCVCMCINQLKMCVVICM